MPHVVRYEPDHRVFEVEFSGPIPPLGAAFVLRDPHLPGGAVVNVRVRDLTWELEDGSFSVTVHVEDVGTP